MTYRFLFTAASTFCLTFGFLPERLPGEALPVRTVPQPQKMRQFFTLDDPRIPRELMEAPAPLPLGNPPVLCLATDGAVWMGQSEGLTRLDPKAAPRDRIQYLHGPRYLPDNEVLNLRADSSGGMWVRTRTGAAHIELVPMTLEQKAKHFEERIRARHDRHGLVSPSRLLRPGDLQSNQMRDDDNDGLWTAIYVAAECFRYAVTQSPEALAAAKKSMEAMLFLEEVAGRRGFPARSYIRKGEPMPRGGEWHWTSDGEYYWKADTSSDEIVGHFFAFGLAYDLLPDPLLKQRIRETAARIMDHILQNGYELIDLDGKPTRWGHWNRAYFDTEPGEGPLNGMQLLSFLKTTAHLTGKARYEEEYQKVGRQLGYFELMLRLKELREELNYSDEELAMLPFYSLLRYEKDDGIRRRYILPAMGLWWENIVREDCPLWTFIYAFGDPKACPPLDGAVRTLYRTPMDTIFWTVRNSHRADILWAKEPDRFGKRQALTLLPPDERPAIKWNANPFVVDSEGGGSGEEDGAAFLLPFWMGRYHGFLK